MTTQQICIHPSALEYDFLKEVAEKLGEVFPKNDIKPVYSVGYQRWQKLTKKQVKALTVKFYMDGNKNPKSTDIISALQDKTAKELLAA